jgi:hypothetical protein
MLMMRQAQSMRPRVFNTCTTIYLVKHSTQKREIHTRAMNPRAIHTRTQKCPKRGPSTRQIHSPPTGGVSLVRLDNGGVEHLRGMSWSLVPERVGVRGSFVCSLLLLYGQIVEHGQLTGGDLAQLGRRFLPGLIHQRRELRALVGQQLSRCAELHHCGKARGRENV